MIRTYRKVIMIISIITLISFGKFQSLSQNVFLNSKNIQLLHPDSVSNELSIKIYTEDSLMISYKILSMPQGIILDSGKVLLIEGINPIQINVRNREKGMYMLKLSDGYRFPFMQTFMKL
jgi:hypothetical protein